MIETFKIMNGIEDIDPGMFFTRASYGATRGHQQKLYKHESRLQIRQHYFSHRVLNDWNNLPDSVIRAKTVNQFKNGLDLHWKSHPQMYDYKFEW